MTTKECFLDCVSGPKSFERRQLIADFIKTGQPNIRRWARGDGKPQGENLIRLRVFLELNGYNLSEMNALKSEIRGLCGMIAFGITSIDELMRVLEYPNRQQVFRLLLHPNEVISARQNKIDDFIRKYALHLKASLNGYFVQYPTPIVEEDSVTTKIDDSKTVPVTITHLQIIDIFVDLLKATMPLAVQIASDEFTAEERRKMHEHAGFNFIFRFSNVMNQLCSETARRDYKRPE